MAGSIYRPHGPPTEPGNSSTSVFVHSGGFSQRLRNASSSFAAAAIAATVVQVPPTDAVLAGNVDPTICSNDLLEDVGFDRD